jgi:hypothetical protein
MEPGRRRFLYQTGAALLGGLVSGVETARAAPFSSGLLGVVMRECDRIEDNNRYTALVSVLGDVRIAAGTKDAEHMALADGRGFLYWVCLPTHDLVFGAQVPVPDHLPEGPLSLAWFRGIPNPTSSSAYALSRASIQNRVQTKDMYSPSKESCVASGEGVSIEGNGAWPELMSLLAAAINKPIGYGFKYTYEFPQEGRTVPYHQRKLSLMYGSPLEGSVTFFGKAASIDIDCPDPTWTEDFAHLGPRSSRQVRRITAYIGETISRSVQETLPEVAAKRRRQRLFDGMIAFP